jgi:hypothetical protein
MKYSGAWVLRCWGAWVLRCCGAGVLMCLGGGPASAQDAPSLRAHHLVLEGGAAWVGGYPVGDVNAQLRTNAAGSAPPMSELAANNVYGGGAPSVTARLGFAVTPRLVLEAAGSFGRPRLGVDISRDVEAAGQRLAGERLQQYVIDGALVWQLPLRLGPRARPFVVGGAGYLRQLHEDRTLVETGQVYYAGLGARFWIRGGTGRARSVGLRADLRGNLRRGGIDFENKVRVYPTLAASLFLGL